MKKLFFTLALLGFIFTTQQATFAQTTKKNKDKKEQHSTPKTQHKVIKYETQEQRAEVLTNSLVKKLNLTEEQKSKVYEVNLQHVQKMDELRNQKAKIDQFRTLRTQRQVAIKGTLTDAQVVKYDKMTKDMEEQRAKGKKNLSSKSDE